MRMLSYTQPIIDDDLMSFCKILCQESAPTVIQVRPLSFCKVGFCFQNVEKVMKKKGGNIVYGWEISNAEGAWLEAQFHAVWRNSPGKLIDVTPEHFGRSSIVFIEDTHKAYDGSRVAPKRYPLADLNKVEEIWKVSDEISEMNRTSENNITDFGNSSKAKYRAHLMVKYVTLIKPVLCI